MAVSRESPTDCATSHMRTSSIPPVYYTGLHTGTIGGPLYVSDGEIVVTTTRLKALLVLLEKSERFHAMLGELLGREIPQCWRNSEYLGWRKAIEEARG